VFWRGENRQGTLLECIFRSLEPNLGTFRRNCVAVLFRVLVVFDSPVITLCDAAINIANCSVREVSSEGVVELLER
jgi:hypothetical protein